MNKPKSIFLVDDDEDDQWLFKEALARTVPSVVCNCASSGQEALAYLMDVANTIPDLVFIDLNMPGMDGRKCLAELKKLERLKEIPVIVYSTSDYPRDKEETLRMGASNFIIKPPDYNSLCELLRKIF